MKLLVYFRKSIRWKLLAIILGVVAALPAILTYIQISVQKDVMEKELDRRIRLMRETLIKHGQTFSGNLVRQAENDLAALDLTNLTDALNKTIKENPELAYAILMNTERVATIHTLRPDLQYQVLTEPEDHFAARLSAAATHEYKKSGQTFLEFIAPIQIGISRWGMLRLGVSLAPLNEEIAASKSEINNQIQRMAMRSILTALFFVIISVVLVWVVSERSIFQPLIQLEQSAAAIAEGQLDIKINVAGRDEISHLAWVFDRMRESLKSLVEDLKIANRLKDEFLANTSHELRTPLNGIIGIAESMLDGATGPLTPPQKANLAMVVTSGKRLASLVNDILDFSKLKHRKLELQIRPLDMKALTHVVLTVSQPLAQTKNLQLISSIQPDIPAVDADENRVQQILYNLISNAIKFTDAGQVEVSARVLLPSSDVTSALLAISVSDTGIGIPPDKFERIFESFEQLDGSSGRIYGGTGLGLSLTKKLVELHGGQLQLQSQVGKGSVFTFTLPVSAHKPLLAESTNAFKFDDASNEIRVAKIQLDIPESAEALATDPDSGRLSPEIGNNRFNILVVDDEPVNLQVLTNQLTLQNYRVVSASSGHTALEVMKLQKFDLVILDVMMPRMSGYEVCQRIRDKFLPTELPVILLTAKNRLADLIEGFEAGANDYLAKPFSKYEMLARIKTQLRLAKISQAYGRFVPQEFMSLLQKESIVDVQLGDQIQREMTVLFVDIREFTPLSEKMTPSENFKFVNSYLSRMEPIIRAYFGIVDKYIGDEIMALFPTGPDDAVWSSVAMLRALFEYNEGRKRAGYRPIQIGIGLNTGSLMLGIVGTEARMEGTVISDTVNLAARLQGLTKKYGASLIISESTRHNLRDPQAFHSRFLGQVQVKGKQQSVAIYEIFNGDPEFIIDLKLKTAATFEDGLKHYLAKEFAEAIYCFKQVLNTHEADKTARLYLDNSARYVSRGTPENWTGVEIFENQ